MNNVWHSVEMVPEPCSMVILVTFLLGVGNFALHKAVLESRNPILGQMPRVLRVNGGKGGLLVEFLILLSALLLVGHGHTGWGWAYLIYSLLNGAGAWLILTRRF